MLWASVRKIRAWNVRECSSTGEYYAIFRIWWLKTLVLMTDTSPDEDVGETVVWGVMYASCHLFWYYRAFRKVGWLSAYNTSRTQGMSIDRWRAGLMGSTPHFRPVRQPIEQARHASCYDSKSMANIFTLCWLQKGEYALKIPCKYHFSWRNWHVIRWAHFLWFWWCACWTLMMFQWHIEMFEKSWLFRRMCASSRPSYHAAFSDWCAAWRQVFLGSSCDSFSLSLTLGIASRKLYRNWLRRTKGRFWLPAQRYGFGSSSLMRAHDIDVAH